MPILATKLDRPLLSIQVKIFFFADSAVAQHIILAGYIVSAGDIVPEGGRAAACP